jgi:stage V sporulation protein B
MQEGSKFIKGALVLTVAGVIVKILGAVYRIPLYGILGDVGMGLFMAVYPVYSMMLSISTAGVPVAVSKLVAERLARGNYKGAHQVFRVALGLMTASGLIVTGVLLLGAKYYTTNVLKTPGALYPLVAIAPSITFFAVKSALRGFFQGQQSMLPTALSQVVEQVVRVGTIFVFSSLLIKYSIELGAAGAALGTVTGAMAALILLVIIYYKRRPILLNAADTGHNSLTSTKRVFKEILALALPITIGSIVVPLVNMVDSTLILPRLQAGGFSETQALALYGDLSGAAMPLVNVPTIFTLALSTSLVPAISNAFAHNNKGQIQKLSSLAMRIGMMIGLPAALGLFLLAEPISILLYKNVDVARSLAVVAFAVIFISLNQTTAPVLQGLGKTYLPVSHMFTGLVIKVVINYLLTAIPSINILGPALGTIVAFAVASLLNYRSIVKFAGGGISLMDTFVKPALNSIAMGVAVFILYPPIYRGVKTLVGAFTDSERLLIGCAVIIVIILALAVYGAASLVTGSITRTELELVPGVGGKLANFLTRLKVLRS